MVLSPFLSLFRRFPRFFHKSQFFILFQKEKALFAEDFILVARLNLILPLLKNVLSPVHMPPCCKL